MSGHRAELVDLKGIPEQDLLLFSELLDDYERHAKAAGLKKKTIDETQRVVRNMMGFTQVAPWFWRVEDLDAYSVHLIDDRSVGNSTLRKYQGEICSINDYLIKSIKYKNLVRTRYKIEIQDISDAGQVAHKDEEEGVGSRAMSPNEIDQFFDALWSMIDKAKEKQARGVKSGLWALLRNLCLFTVAYHFGLRVHEAANVRISKFSEDPENLEYGRYGIVQVLGKAKKGADKPKRSIPITFDNTAENLKQYMKTVRPYFAARADSEAQQDGIRVLDFMFLSERGTPICLSSIQAAFAKVRKAAGFEDERITFHSLRKSYATHNYMRGMSIDTIRRLLGHSHISVTQIYLGLTDRHMQDDIKRAQQTALDSAFSGDMDD